MSGGCCGLDVDENGAGVDSNFAFGAAAVLAVAQQVGVAP